MADELNTRVVMGIRAANIMTVPIDATLSIPGEAADAAAVGAALADKADKSELQNAIRVNGQEADAQGLILVTGDDIKTGDGAEAPTLSDAISALEDRTGADIPVGPGGVSIADAINSGGTRTADQIRMSPNDTRTVYNVAESQAQMIANLQSDLADVNSKTAEDIRVSNATEETIATRLASMEAEAVKSVNDVLPDENGDVRLRVVEYADNLTTDKTQEADGEFLIRTAGGNEQVSDGNAWLLRMMGNSVHTGFVAEELTMTVVPMPRTIPDAITASLDAEVFKAYVGQAGTYTLTYNGISWGLDPALYGLTISNDPVAGDVIEIYWDGSNDPVLTVNAVERTAPAAITATINRDTFVAYVDGSGTISLYYTNEWSEDPALYGITVENVPIRGDQIRIVYVKEERGTITVATPTALVATGWNLYAHALGYARVVKYSNNWAFKIGGTYTSISWAATQTGTRQALTPNVSGIFSVPGDGYVFVVGGNDTDTYILMTWSDWGGGPAGTWEGYTESTVDLSDLMDDYFPYGLMRVGDVRDEINISTGEIISRIERMTYTDGNRAMVAVSGLPYDFDEDYIYVVRLTPIIEELEMVAEYTVNDHGMEMIVDSEVAPYLEIMYGINLKDKLRRDVVTWNMTVAELEAMGT